MAGLELRPIRLILDHHSIRGASGLITLNQKKHRDVYCSSRIANWWNMFATSAVMAYG